MIQNALNEILPRKVRLVLYVVAFVLLLGLTAWQAAEGNLLEALVAFLTALAPLLAAGNITPPTEQLAENTLPAVPLQYEEPEGILVHEETAETRGPVYPEEDSDGPKHLAEDGR